MSRMLWGKSIPTRSTWSRFCKMSIYAWMHVVVVYDYCWAVFGGLANGLHYSHLNTTRRTLASMSSDYYLCVNTYAYTIYCGRLISGVRKTWCTTHQTPMPRPRRERAFKTYALHHGGLAAWVVLCVVCFASRGNGDMWCSDADDTVFHDQYRLESIDKRVLLVFEHAREWRGCIWIQREHREQPALFSK